MTERIVVPGKRLGMRPTPPHVMAKIPNLARYVSWPNPPAGPVDVSQAITTWPMFANDRLGDCTCAAVGHMVEIFTKEVTGQPKILTDQDIIALYQTQGYVPGNSATDNGADLGGVCATWKAGQWAPDKILAYAQIDVRNHALLKTALWLFSGLYVGIGLPITAQGQQVWDVVSAPPSQNGAWTWGGHAVNIIQIDDAGMTLITWGGVKRMTWAFWNEYGFEAFAVVPADYDQLQGKPVVAVGFDEQQLLADMAQLAN